MTAYGSLMCEMSVAEVEARGRGRKTERRVLKAYRRATKIAGGRSVGYSNAEYFLLLLSEFMCRQCIWDLRPAVFF
jgi:hypothetical protein